MSAYNKFFKDRKEAIAKFLHLDKASVTAFLQKFAKSELMKKQIEQFVGGAIGIKQLIKTAISTGLQALVQTLGIAMTGGVVNIIGIIAWVGGEAAMKLTKPLFAVTLVAIWGVCGIIGFAVTQIMFMSPVTVAHANMAPTDYEVIGVELFPEGQPWDNPEIGFGDPPHDGICPVSSSSRCTQGPYGTFSHVQMGTMAVDISGNPGLWRAPSDGTVTQTIDSIDCGWDPGKSSGGKVLFVDNEGNEYRLLHVVPLVGTGPVTQGTAIARLATNLPVSSCWTGAHYHLDTKANGGWINSLDWYSKLGCNLSCP